MKGKLANYLIVGLVAYGTIFLGTLAGVGRDGNLMPTIFFLFLATIIAFQVVPALMLFGALIRELFRRIGKKAQMRADNQN